MLEEARDLSMGQRIRRERICHCLSQSNLAEIIQASISSINRWENDKSIPRFYYRKQLCRALGKRVEEMFTYEVGEEVD